MIHRLKPQYLLLTFLGLFFSLYLTHLPFITPPLIAQGIIQPEAAAEIIYQQFPEIPLENQYIRKETQQIDPEYTLLSRFIRYHRDVQRRSLSSRLDWKLTFADYLGANESIRSERYPGYDTLTENPLEKDTLAVRQLNRRQRQAIVDLLARVYQQESESNEAQSPENPHNQPNLPNNTENHGKPSLSQPGDAQLLQP